MHRNKITRETGPGPKYMLGSLLGYENHDVTKTRYPSYTIGPKLGTARSVPTPGPKYAFDKIYRTGKYSSPAWVHLDKQREARSQGSPGANRYQPFLNPYVTEKKPPEYSILGKLPKPFRTCGPAPNKYLLPTTIAVPIPDKKNAPAFTQAPKWHEPTRYLQSPGPMRYSPVELDLYKSKAPEYTILGKNRLSTLLETIFSVERLQVNHSTTGSMSFVRPSTLPSSLNAKDGPFDLPKDEDESGKTSYSQYWYYTQPVDPPSLVFYFCTGRAEIWNGDDWQISEPCLHPIWPRSCQDDEVGLGQGVIRGDVSTNSLGIALGRRFSNMRPGQPAAWNHIVPLAWSDANQAIVDRSGHNASIYKLPGTLSLHAAANVDRCNWTEGGPDSYDTPK
ncbi:hypothetical protein AAG570_010283 [Ranatra chinensis]|uniref:Uncharacterized protein n=1 Tax=Ranatra chinensis TaxID=642074 RepID=A0ABD0YY63_9HEMI